jgi:hypothetical protein
MVGPADEGKGFQRRVEETSNGLTAGRGGRGLGGGRGGQREADPGFARRLERSTIVSAGHPWACGRAGETRSRAWSGLVWAPVAVGWGKGMPWVPGDAECAFATIHTCTFHISNGSSGESTRTVQERGSRRCSDLIQHSSITPGNSGVRSARPRIEMPFAPNQRR